MKAKKLTKKDIERARELKTMKDLITKGEVFVLTHLAPHNSLQAIKWIKYFNSNEGDLNVIISSELKQEAIKWIKHFNSNKGDFIDGEGWDKFCDSGYDEYTSHAYGNVIDWIKHFFNITDEDLK